MKYNRKNKQTKNPLMDVQIKMLSIGYLSEVEVDKILNL